MTVQKNIKRYLVRELPTSSPGLGGQARDINNSGMAVGAEHCGETSQLASAWNAEGRVDLEFLNDRQSVASCVNELSEIGGSVTSPAGKRKPCIWRKGRVEILDEREGMFGVAHGMNNHSTVVGFEQQTNDYSYKAYPVQWKDEGAFPLDLPGGGCAFDINDQNMIVGYVDVDRKTRAFVWRDGSCRWMSPKRYASQAYGINESGHVVGLAYTGRQTSSPFISIDGRFDLITDLPLGSHMAKAINNRGYVVGYADVPKSDEEKNDEIAFLWYAGKSTYLNDLIDPLEEWKIVNALGINDHCQIASVGERGGVRRAILLQPDWA